MTSPQPSGNLVRSGSGPIKDKAWSQVDLRKDEKKLETDLPSDIEPQGS